MTCKRQELHARGNQPGRRMHVAGTKKAKEFRTVPQQAIFWSAITGWEGLRECTEGILRSRRDLSRSIITDPTQEAIAKKCRLYSSYPAMS